MPGRKCRNFYILQYYHRGSDGRVAICCSKYGNLGVVKFLLCRDQEENALKKEAGLWNLLWGTRCRVVELKGRFALLMPFCFHNRIISLKPTFCGLQIWNRLEASPNLKLNDQEVDEFTKLDHNKFSVYENDPMKAAKEAMTCMLNQNVRHDDLKLAHVALLPSFSDSSNTIDLIPVLLDLTRTTPVSDTSNLLEKFTSVLLDQLKNPE